MMIDDDDDDGDTCDGDMTKDHPNLKTKSSSMAMQYTDGEKVMLSRSKKCLDEQFPSSSSSVSNSSSNSSSSSNLDPNP